MEHVHAHLHPHRNFWLLLVSLVLIGCGLYLLFHPATALVTSALIVGIAFIMVGASYLMSFHHQPAYLYPLLGILDILIGCVLLSNLGVTAATLPIIFGFWCFFTGTGQIIAGLMMRGRMMPFGRLMCLTGVIGLIFGLLMFLYPWFAVLTLTFLLGSYLIVYGCFEFGRYLRA